MVSEGAARLMNEPWQERGPSGIEEFRNIQGLARDGQVEEALDRALLLLETPRLGRKLEAKVHNLICKLYTEGYSRPGTAAALHGEEAVRLADLLHDPWLKCEGLTQLVHTYSRLGDFDRAMAACEAVQTEADRNPGVVPGGPAAVWVLKAEVFKALGDLEAAMAALGRAEAHAREVVDGTRVMPDIRSRRIDVLLLCGKWEAVRVLMPAGEGNDSLAAQLQRAWLATLEQPYGGAAAAVRAVLTRAQEKGDQAAVAQSLALHALIEQGRSGDAPRLARQALNRAIDAGRADLARRLRSRLASLLEAD